MKICIATTYFARIEGGAETSTRLLVEALTKTEHEIVVLRTDTEKVETAAKLITIPFLPHNITIKATALHFQYATNYLAKKFTPILKHEQPDIIIAPDIILLPALQKATTIPIIPIIRDFRFLCNLPNVNQAEPIRLQIPKKEYKQKLKELAGTKSIILYPLIKDSPKRLQEALKKSKTIIAVSNYVKKQLQRCNLKNIEVIYETYPDWTPIDIQKPIVLAVGRLDESKGFRTLIQAMKNTKHELHIIGWGPDEQHLRTIATPNVIFHGRQPLEKVKEAMQEAQIIAVPSIIPETFGMVALEAMTVGKPVIASNVGALPEVVTGQTGIIVEPTNIVAWTEAINTLLKNPELCKKLGDSGRQRALITFSREKNITRFLEVLTALQAP